MSHKHCHFKVREHKPHSTNNKFQLPKGNFKPESIFIYDGQDWIVKHINDLEKIKGDKGDRGLRGEKGDDAQSLLGPRGPRGFPGDKGDQGIPGIKGDQGIPGIKGDQGIQGIPGLSPFVQDLLKKNLHIGENSGKEEQSSENVCYGPNTGTKNSKGMNTLTGVSAGSVLTGMQNSFYGAYAGAHSEDANYCTFNGCEAGFKNVQGIGNTFDGCLAGCENIDGSFNTFGGLSSGNQNKSGNNLTFYGANSGTSCIRGEDSICLGAGADVLGEEPINQTVIGVNVKSMGNNSITFAKNLKTFPHGTEVNFSHPGGGMLFPVSSSIRWKENVEDISQKIDTSNLYNLRPVTFNGTDSSDLCLGLIAEEVDKFFPTLVPKDEQGLPSSVRYSLLSVLVLEEIKKLKIEVDKMKSLLNK